MRIRWSVLRVKSWNVIIFWSKFTTKKFKMSILDVSNFVKKGSLTMRSCEIPVPDTSGLVKKADHDIF